MPSRTVALVSLGLLISIQVACSRGGDDELVARARTIHQNVITIDTHDDLPERFTTSEADPGVRGEHQVDLPKMEEGGLDAAFFIVYVRQKERTPENYDSTKREALEKFAAIHRMTDSMYPDRIELAYSADDVERIHAAGRLVACIGIENGYAIGRDLTLLERYHGLGARYMTLTHNGHNDIGDSSDPRSDLGDAEAEHGGLSEFGEQVIAEMNRLGIMVDVSHVSKQTMLDAVRLSRAPIIASHSSVRTLRDVSRNLDDEQLLALRENGGVVQIVAVSEYLKEDPPERREALGAVREELGITSQAWPALSYEQRRAYRRRRAQIDERLPGAGVKDLVDHIDYAVQLIGIDHVGIGSDFDGGGGVQGWRDASQTFNVTLELVRRGYSEAEIRKLWGGNVLRVWREVERVAADLGRGAVTLTDSG